MHLEAEGIQAHLSDAETVNMDWLLGNALGYIKLQVLSDQVEQAVSLLAQRGSERRESPNCDRAADSDRCLSCDAPLLGGESSCSSCGWTYSKARDDPSDEGECQSDAGSGRQEDGSTAMDSLRGLKKPILLFFLSPFIFAGLLLVAAILDIVVRFLVRLVR